MRSGNSELSTASMLTQSNVEVQKRAERVYRQRLMRARAFHLFALAVKALKYEHNSTHRPCDELYKRIVFIAWLDHLLAGGGKFPQMVQVLKLPKELHDPDKFFDPNTLNLLAGVVSKMAIPQTPQNNPYVTSRAKGVDPLTLGALTVAGGFWWAAMSATNRAVQGIGAIAVETSNGIESIGSTVCWVSGGAAVLGLGTVVAISYSNPDDVKNFIGRVLRRLTQAPIGRFDCIDVREYRSRAPVVASDDADRRYLRSRASPQDHRGSRRSGEAREAHEYTEWSRPRSGAQEIYDEGADWSSYSSRPGIHIDEQPTQGEFKTMVANLTSEVAIVREMTTITRSRPYTLKIEFLLNKPYQDDPKLTAQICEWFEKNSKDREKYSLRVFSLSKSKSKSKSKSQTYAMRITTSDGDHLRRFDTINATLKMRTNYTLRVVFSDSQSTQIEPLAISVYRNDLHRFVP